jgi:hypothetical protein
MHKHTLGNCEEVSVLSSLFVPVITLEGDANGAPHPPPDSYAKKFSGKYSHHNLKGIGHNLTQEAPQAFA